MYRFYTKILLIVCNAVNGVSIKRKNKTYFISRRHTQTTADMCSADLAEHKVSPLRGIRMQNMTAGG